MLAAAWFSWGTPFAVAQVTVPLSTQLTPVQKVPSVPAINATLLLRPAFDAAAILDQPSGKSHVQLSGVRNVEFENSICSVDGRAQVCRRMLSKYFVEVDTLRAEECRDSAGTLECVMAGLVPLSNGAQRTVRIGATATPSTATARAFVAYRCRPDLTSVVPAGAGLFRLSGTGVVVMAMGGR